MPKNNDKGGGLPGRLYVFEGPDGVGKTSVVEGVARRLREAGDEVQVLSFPGRTPGTLGTLIYELHHDFAQFGVKELNPTSLQVLHVAAHIDCIERRILPAMSSGMTVILDRFWWSTVVYGKADGVPNEAIAAMVALEMTAWRDVRPDAAFLVSPSDPFREKLSTEPWRRVCRAYQELAETERRRHPVEVVENTGSIEEVVERIARRIGEARANVPPSTGSSAHVGREADGRRRQSSRALMRANRWAPTKTTAVFETYWRFASERQAVFFRRLRGQEPPWTDDPILREHRFTNTYRASDRVSQFLIRRVIYEGDQSPEEVFFRTIMFKTFNKIETWRLLEGKLGAVTYADYSFKRYDRVLSAALKKGERVYSAAYIMPSGGRSFGHRVKHRNHLKLIELMMADSMPTRVCDARSMQQVFEMLRAYPMIGDFLAYQYATDLNYSVLTDFSEMSFTVPGPGARDGIRKCFSDYGGLTEVDLIKLMADRQAEEFESRGIDFQDLWGRPLQLIDIQNVFCEVDKYARVAHPDTRGITGRTKIKRKFRITAEPIQYFYPPKWDINEAVRRTLDELQDQQKIREEGTR